MTAKINYSKLLELLSDGEFHSGEALGRYFKVSRTAIWKVIQNLQAYGLELNHVHGKGYQLLEPVELLDLDKIQHQLSASARHATQIEIHHSLPSSNSYLTNKPNRQPGDVCFVEQQTAGKGRLGRTWFSPYARNLYTSLFWRFDRSLSECMGLSLVIGLACTRALGRQGAEGIQLKWPNDLYYQDQKLGGVLIEMSGEIQGPCDAVIGIGLNLDMPRHLATDIQQPWIDLKSVLGLRASRNQLAAILLEELHAAIAQFEAKGFSAFMTDWQDNDYLCGRPITITLSHSGQQSHGIARGVNEQGALLVEQAGEINALHSGEVSIRINKT